MISTSKFEVSASNFSRDVISISDSMLLLAKDVIGADSKHRGSQSNWKVLASDVSGHFCAEIFIHPPNSQNGQATINGSHTKVFGDMH